MLQFVSEANAHKFISEVQMYKLPMISFLEARIQPALLFELLAAWKNTLHTEVLMPEKQHLQSINNKQEMTTEIHGSILLQNTEPEL